MIKLYFWGASKVGVLSEFEKKEFISQFGNSSKLIVVKNIVSEINQELLKPNSINNPNKKFDALFVSRIEKGKGLEDLLNAVPHLLKSYSEFKLGIAGSGNRMNACKKIADDLNIQQNIKWLGYIMDQQLNQAFNESKIFVFTSHFPEGMPMSMIEALLHGIPVITTKNRFALSYFQENENVIFVERNNPIELSKKIIYLLNDQAAQEKMRMNNFHFLSQFTQDKVGEEFANIYVQMKNKKN
jgi:glycosyltransferase involved in cell wall biosynthesis